MKKTIFAIALMLSTSVSAGTGYVMGIKTDVFENNGIWIAEFTFKDKVEADQYRAEVKHIKNVMKKINKSSEVRNIPILTTDTANNIVQIGEIGGIYAAEGKKIIRSTTGIKIVSVEGTGNYNLMLNAKARSLFGDSNVPPLCNKERFDEDRCREYVNTSTGVYEDAKDVFGRSNLPVSCEKGSFVESRCYGAMENSKSTLKMNASDLFGENNINACKDYAFNYEKCNEYYQEALGIREMAADKYGDQLPEYCRTGSFKNANCYGMIQNNEYGSNQFNEDDYMVNKQAKVDLAKDLSSCAAAGGYWTSEHKKCFIDQRTADRYKAAYKNRLTTTESRELMDQYDVEENLYYKTAQKIGVNTQFCSKESFNEYYCRNDIKTYNDLNAEKDRTENNQGQRLNKVINVVGNILKPKG